MRNDIVQARTATRNAYLQGYFFLAAWVTMLLPLVGGASHRNWPLVALPLGIVMGLAGGWSAWHLQEWLNPSRTKWGWAIHIAVGSVVLGVLLACRLVR